MTELLLDRREEASAWEPYAEKAECLLELYPSRSLIN